MAADPLWGIDLGGSKIEILVLDSGSNTGPPQTRGSAKLKRPAARVRHRTRRLVKLLMSGHDRGSMLEKAGLMSAGL